MPRYFNYAGYNEVKVLRYDIDDVDLHILCYINQCFRRLETIETDEGKFVWIRPEKILEDNPRLGFKRRMLDIKLNELINKGLLKKIVKCDGKIKKTYLHLMEAYDDLTTSEIDSVETTKNEVVEEINVKAETTKKNEEKSDDEKEKKKNLLTREQTKMLNDFTDYTPLKEAINEFVKMRIKIKKPMTDRAFKMLLGKLKELSNSVSTQVEILNQSIFFSYQSVYPLSKKYMKEKYSAKIYDYTQECDY